ncbi:MAG: hypothetical protein M1818_006381 [Claussenomyces sp. TS43310]|nr:MAG: hypothetical protein M1818_006381 [Claussenomyces sp. TS43310]
MNPPSHASTGLVNEQMKEKRRESTSVASEDSQTAAEFIDSQLQLEADAREALPYKFDTCTRPLGALRQLLFACLTCNPPPSGSSKPHTSAAVCYSCSVQCHGDHTLVELFNKRDFVCDCGTTRMPSTSPCALRVNPLTNQKGNVVSEPAETNNKYNQNFKNRFCCCECDYDPQQQKGTMFQCLGLGNAELGGCGEDWYHSACLVGLGPDWYESQKTNTQAKPAAIGGLLETITEVASAAVDSRSRAAQTNSRLNDQDSPANSDNDTDDDELPPPPGFPHEDDFEGFICYKCVDANPWIKRYAGTKGFLPPVFRRSAAPSPEALGDSKIDPTETKSAADIFSAPAAESRKRKVGDSREDDASDSSKRVKGEDLDLNAKTVPTPTTGAHGKSDQRSDVGDQARVSCEYEKLPAPPGGSVSLFFKADFRANICRCSDCFPRVAKHPQLLEEEYTYEPPVSEDEPGDGGSTAGSGSLLDRGETALKNVDRVRAIEGVMAYNHLKEKLKPFFKEFAESGKAISAEDIKAHFAKMRGDEEAIRQAGEDAASNADNRREQSGY